MSAAADNARLLALQARVRTLEERLEGVQEPLETLQEVVGELAGGVEELASRQRAAKPAPAWWPTMPGDEHAARWPALVAWVRDVLAARYARQVGKSVAPCWADHPAAVDALTSAWLTWLVVYDRTADARDAATWQTVTLPELLERCRAELADCLGRGGRGCAGVADVPDVGFRG